MDKFQVIITNKAQSDLADCVGFVKRVSIEAAKQLASDLYSSFYNLDTFPEKNPVFPMPKSFPFVLRKQIVNQRYIVLYTVEKQDVIIYRVLDARRKFDYII